jgi:hypothetical protein
MAWLQTQENFHGLLRVQNSARQALFLKWKITWGKRVSPLPEDKGSVRVLGSNWQVRESAAQAGAGFNTGGGSQVVALVRTSFNTFLVQCLRSQVGRPFSAAEMKAAPCLEPPHK